MKIAIYKGWRDEKPRGIQIRATLEEYDLLGLSHPGGFRIRIKDSVLTARKVEAGGVVFKRHVKGREWRICTSLATDFLFPAAVIPPGDIGEPGGEVLVMTDLNQFTGREFQKQNRKRKSSMSVDHAPIVSNAKIMRKVHELLGDWFDENRHQYTGGWSDEKVAREADCSMEFVRRQREEAYGHLAEPINLKEFDTALALLRTAVKDLEAFRESIK